MDSNTEDSIFFASRGAPVNFQPETTADWVDDTIRDMWKLQKDNGVIEGWHGDGNFARTTLMYGLWKSQGLTASPYREDIELGAVQHDGALYISFRAAKKYKGKLRFDHARHNNVFKLPLDWPRINQFPEWFTADPASEYEIHDVETGTRTAHTGKSLIEGLPVTINPGAANRLIARKR